MITDIKLQNGSGKIISIGATKEDDYVLEFVDWGTASISSYPIVYFPTENSERILNHTWQPRPVSIIGHVIGKDEVDIQQQCDALEIFIGVQEDIKLLYNYYKLTFRAIKRVKFAKTERENNEVLCKFQIEGIAVDPKWYDDSSMDKEELEELKIPMFHFPLIINAGIPSVVFGRQYKALSIINYTGVVSGVIFRFKPSLYISNLMIMSEWGDITETLTLNGAVQANTEIVIDTREGFHSVKVGGVDKTADISAGSTWLRLRPGINIVSYYFSGSTSTVLNAVVEKPIENLFEVQI